MTCFCKIHQIAYLSTRATHWSLCSRDALEFHKWASVILSSHLLISIYSLMTAKVMFHHWPECSACPLPQQHCLCQWNETKVSRLKCSRIHTFPPQDGTETCMLIHTYQKMYLSRVKAGPCHISMFAQPKEVMWTFFVFLFLFFWKWPTRHSVYT